MKLKLLLIFMVCILKSNAQKSVVGNWFMYTGNNYISKNWIWYNEVQYRNFNFAGDLEQFLLRTGIGYNLTEKNNNLLIGLGYFNSEPYIQGTSQKSKIIEYRLFQQFITRQNFGRVFLTHRYRFEERFINDQLNPDKNLFRSRARYQIAIQVALNKSKLEKNAFYFSSSNEIFINTRGNFFDRNRLYAALGYCFNNSLRLELGMMAQSLQSKTRSQFQIAIINNAALFHN